MPLDKYLFTPGDPIPAENLDSIDPDNIDSNPTDEAYRLSRFDAKGFLQEPAIAFPIYENISEGDFLKLTYLESAYQISKIIGINSATASDANKNGNILKVKKNTDGELIILTSTNLYWATYNGTKITALTELTANTGNIYDFDIVSATKILIYSVNAPKTYARIANLGGTITYGSEVTVCNSTDNNWISDYKCAVIGGDKVIFNYGHYFNQPGNLRIKAGTISGDAITLGGETTLYGAGEYYSAAMGGFIVKSNTDVEIFYCGRYAQGGTYAGGRYAQRLSLSGSTITAGTALLLESWGASAVAEATGIKLVHISENKSLALIRRRTDGTTLDYFTITNSGTTLTANTVTSITSIFSSDDSYPILCRDGMLYLLRFSDRKVFLFSHDSSRNYLTLLNSGVVIKDAYCPAYFDDDNFITFFSNDTAPKTQKSLLDHYNFIGVANQNYTAGKYLSVRTVIDTEKTDLNPNTIYYLTSSGQNITTDSTYAKLGVAITNSLIRRIYP